MKKKAMKKTVAEEDAQKEHNTQSTDRALIISIIVILALFSLFFVVYKIMNISQAVKTIQELHEENLKGKLDADEGYIYNGYSFVKANGMWFSQVQRFRTRDVYNVQFHYGPRDLENVAVAGNISGFKEFNGTYVAFDPSAKDFKYTALASAELSLNLAQVFNILPVAACTQNLTKACYTRPIVNCSSSTRPVIYIENADKPAVIRENNACIRVMGNGTDLVKATDRLLFEWFGFMP